MRSFVLLGQSIMSALGLELCMDSDSIARLVKKGARASAHTATGVGTKGFLSALTLAGAPPWTAACSFWKDGCRKPCTLFAPFVCKCHVVIRHTIQHATSHTIKGG